MMLSFPWSPFFLSFTFSGIIYASHMYMSTILQQQCFFEAVRNNRVTQGASSWYCSGWRDSQHGFSIYRHYNLTTGDHNKPDALPRTANELAKVLFRASNARQNDSRWSKLFWVRIWGTDWSHYYSFFPFLSLLGGLCLLGLCCRSHSYNNWKLKIEGCLKKRFQRRGPVRMAGSSIRGWEK